MDMVTYTEEFHKLFLRSRVQEEEVVKVIRYIGGLRENIQEEISLWAMTTMQKCFQLALKVEEKNKRRQESNSKNRGRGRGFHRGGYKGKDNESRTQEESKPMEQNNHIVITKEATREVEILIMEVEEDITSMVEVHSLLP